MYLYTNAHLRSQRFFDLLVATALQNFGVQADAATQRLRLPKLRLDVPKFRLQELEFRLQELEFQLDEVEFRLQELEFRLREWSPLSEKKPLPSEDGRGFH